MWSPRHNKANRLLVCAVEHSSTGGSYLVFDALEWAADLCYYTDMTTLCCCVSTVTIPLWTLKTIVDRPRHASLFTLATDSSAWMMH